MNVLVSLLDGQSLNKLLNRSNNQGVTPIQLALEKGIVHEILIPQSLKN